MAVVLAVHASTDKGLAYPWILLLLLLLLRLLLCLLLLLLLLHLLVPLHPGSFIPSQFQFIQRILLLPFTLWQCLWAGGGSFIPVMAGMGSGARRDW